MVLHLRVYQDPLHTITTAYTLGSIITNSRMQHLQRGVQPLPQEGIP